jgi:hypothetical protein
MALPNAGVPLSILDIANEFGGAAPHALSEYYGVATGVPASGNPISISDFYGKSADAPISASGGSIHTSGIYRYHTFTSNGTFTINSVAQGAFSNTITYELFGGGGPGGERHGGGGAGGTRRLFNVAAAVGSKTVTVGGGSGPSNAAGGTTSVTGLTSSTGGTSGGDRGNCVGGSNSFYSGGSALDYSEGGMGGAALALRLMELPEMALQFSEVMEGQGE